MSLKTRPTPPRDVTHELTQAFQLSNFCRELAKSKLVPGTRRRLGQGVPGRIPDALEERAAECKAVRPKPSDGPR